MSVRFAAQSPDHPIVLFSDFSLAVHANELVVVAGRSGSGKTTLLNVAAGLVRPTVGEVYWGSERIGGMAADDRIRKRGAFIGYVFQNAGLIDTLTAIENVALAAIPPERTLDHFRAKSLLGKFGLDGRSRHFPHQLSGGEQQRVAIARALYADPPMLIVDDPTANADGRTADEIIGFLRELADDGRAILVASHDRGLIYKADRVIEIESQHAP